MTKSPKSQPKDGFDAIEYPLDFSFKAVCDKTEGIQNIVKQAIISVVAEKKIKQTSLKESSAGRYVSITIVVGLVDRQQLEGIYGALSACPEVRMTL